MPSPPSTDGAWLEIEVEIFALGVVGVTDAFAEAQTASPAGASTAERLLARLDLGAAALPPFALDPAASSAAGAANAAAASFVETERPLTAAARGGDLAFWGENAAVRKLELENFDEDEDEDDEDEDSANVEERVVAEGVLESLDGTPAVGDTAVDAAHARKVIQTSTTHHTNQIAELHRQATRQTQESESTHH